MKIEQFEKCAEKLIQEYKRSKAKHADFDTIDRAWKAIQREYSEVKNEVLRDEMHEDSLAEEMMHLSNVALQGYMFLMEAPEKYDDSKVIEKEKAMNKEWWDGVIEACEALRDGKDAQWKDKNGKYHGKFDFCLHQNDGGKITFNVDYDYRAKPEPKLRPLTPQEWFDALMAGKRVTEIKTNWKQKLYFRLDFGRNEILTISICTGQDDLNFWTPK